MCLCLLYGEGWLSDTDGAAETLLDLDLSGSGAGLVGLSGYHWKAGRA